MDRAAHLQWAKDRAFEYLDRGQVDDAFASFVSDLGKHDELGRAVEFCTMVGFPMLMQGVFARDPNELRKFIQGFN